MTAPTPERSLAGGKVKVYRVGLTAFCTAGVSVPASAQAMVCVIDRASVKNAVDRETASGLHEAFVSFAHDASLCVAILAGAGGTFCAGADLKSIASSSLASATGSEGGNLLDPDMDAMAPMGVTRLAMNKPVIAAISGFAVAGGLELALWADLRIATASASLGVLCRLRGVPLIDGGTVRLPALIGGSRAADLSLTGRLVGAKEAHHMGLVNYIVADNAEASKGWEAVVEKALEVAAGLASVPQTCMLNDRSSMLNALYPASHHEQAGVDLRLKGALRQAMQREFELGLHSLSQLMTEGQVGAFVNRSADEKQQDRSRRTKL
ncbi:hypothetical protein L1887_49680 [Cichorium endivia]|nr:hypothetical protein L1887_49680 [Cichorium endivia]